MNLEKETLIGESLPRVDAFGKVTGKAKFAEDYNLPYQIYAKVLRAKYPHAKILSIDISNASKLPGVEIVLTAKDIPGKKVFGVVEKNQSVLADDKVRYLGDGIALVAANTPEIAIQALDLIDVEYEVLPVLSSPIEAMKPGSISIHEGENVFVHHKVKKGNIQQSFSESEIILKREFSTQHIEHSYLEPEAALAQPNEQGGIRIVGSIQNVFSTRRSVAEVLNLDLAEVEIVQATLGGSFGGKDEASTLLSCRACLLAMATGKPVKMVNSREESMLESYKRHPYFMNYKVGLKKDGILSAFEIQCIADGGAYASTSAFVTWRSAIQATGPYRCENVKTDTYSVYTNNNYTGAMRGFGSPQVCFASETLIDELAETFNTNPFDLRLKNILRDSDVTATNQKLNHKVSLEEVLQKIEKASKYIKKWNLFRLERNNSDPIKKGIGLACSYRGVSLGAEGVDAAGVIVSVQTDGSVIISSGLVDMGQGAQTVMSQITAEVLGVSPDRIQYMNTSTSKVPDSGPTVASRTTIMGGSAAKQAAEKVIFRMKQIANTHFESTDLESIITKNNFFIDRKNGHKISFSEVADSCFQKGVSLFGFGWFKGPEINWDEQTGQGDAYFSYVYGANVAEVEVDTETGKVNVRKFYSAHEVGQAINKAMVRGQMYGGVAMGLGYGLLEDFNFVGGKPQSLNFDEYLIPTSMDVPKIDCIIVENPDPVGPFGAKSIGEPANEIAAPAIINAIANATGKRIYQLPANLEQVLLGHKLIRTENRSSEL